MNYKNFKKVFYFSITLYISSTNCVILTALHSEENILNSS